MGIFAFSPTGSLVARTDVSFSPQPAPPITAPPLTAPADSYVSGGSAFSGASLGIGTQLGQFATRNLQTNALNAAPADPVNANDQGVTGPASGGAGAGLIDATSQAAAQPPVPPPPQSSAPYDPYAFGNYTPSTETKYPFNVGPKDATGMIDGYLGDNPTNVNPITGQVDNNRLWSGDDPNISIRYTPHEYAGPNHHFHIEQWDGTDLNNTYVPINQQGIKGATGPAGSTVASNPGAGGASGASEPGSGGAGASGSAPPVDPGTAPPVDPGAAPPVDPGAAPPVDPGAAPPVDPGAAPPVDPGATPPVDVVPGDGTVLPQILGPLGKVLVPVGIGYSLYDVATSNDPSRTTATQLGGWAGGLAGAEFGGTVGFALGGPVGGVIGGVIGGVVGGVGGSMAAAGAVDVGRSAVGVKNY